MASTLNKMSQTVEDAVKELVTIFIQASLTNYQSVDDNGTEESSCKFYMNDLPVQSSNVMFLSDTLILRFSLLNS